MAYESIQISTLTTRAFAKHIGKYCAIIATVEKNNKKPNTDYRNGAEIKTLATLAQIARVIIR